MPDKALFIGHSLIGQVMPNMFNNFVAGQDLQADAQIINGAPLRWNWDNGAQGEGVNARTVLPSGEYSTVVVTEAIPLDDQIMWNDTYGYAKQYFDLAVSANPETQFYVYETWHYIGADTAEWRGQLSTDLSKWEGIVNHINDNAAPNAPDALIIPAGQALANLYDAIAAGQVPGVSSIRDLFSDDIHLNDTGNWFIAALYAEVIGGVDAANLPLETSSTFGVAYDGPDAALAAAMNAVIDDTLATYTRDGVDDGSVTPAPPNGAPLLLTGDDGGNYLVGDDTANLMQGYAGNDTLSGGMGDDTLDGGADWDVVMYDGDQGDFTLTISASGIEIEDRQGGQGTDQLRDIEALQFGGTPATSTLDLTQVSATSQLGAAQMESFVELYIAYFNRAPDALGLNFWGAAYANCTSLQEIAALFVDQNETRDAYPSSMNNVDVVNAVYSNILGRNADADGFAFWRDALDSGAFGSDQFILELLEGAKAVPAAGMSNAFVAQQTADRQFLAEKTDIGAYFSVHLGMSDVTEATAVMAMFDGTNASFDRAIDLIDDYHAAVVQSGSDGFLMPLVGVLETPDWM